MKRMIAVVLLAAMLLCGWALAETEDGGEDFGFDFMDEGYDGEWVQVDALNIEFCQPEGWTEVDGPEGSAYAALNADSTAGVSISLAAEGVDSIAAWAEDNPGDYRQAEANFYDALVLEEEERMEIFINASGGKVIRFDFRRNSSDMLPREFALKIVGSTCDIWDEADAPFGEEGVDDEAFDFGEAFEADAN